MQRLGWVLMGLSLGCADRAVDPEGREAEARSAELARNCAGSTERTKGSAEPEQAQGEALLESSQYGDSDGSVHAPSVDTGVTCGAYSTGSLTMGVGCILEHRADSGSVGARHVLTARAEASNTPTPTPRSSPPKARAKARAPSPKGRAKAKARAAEIRIFAKGAASDRTITPLPRPSPIGHPS